MLLRLLLTLCAGIKAPRKHGLRRRKFYLRCEQLEDRIVPSGGTITTVAGGTGTGNVATAAAISGAHAVAVDTSGNLFIADTYHNTISEVSASTGIITTVAGNGAQGYSDGGAATAAALSNPQSVAVDASGNVYIADNDRIRKVAAGTGIITTVAGNGAQGYSGDGGAATAAELDLPFGVAVDASGNLYIADFENSRIRKVTSSTGIITTVAGGGTNFGTDGLGDGGPATAAELGHPYGVAVDSGGNLYIADGYNGRIRKVSASTGIIVTVAGGGTSSLGDGGAATAASLGPAGVTVDASGNLFIADFGNNRIREVFASTGIITTIAGNGSAGYSGDGGPATAAELNDAECVAVDGSGNVYIADAFNDRIRKVAAGIITTVAGNGYPGYSGDGGPATAAELNNPYGVAVDGSGNVYIADSNNHRIREVSASTGIITTVAGNGTFGYSGDGGPATAAELDAAGVAVDAAGDIFIADNYNGVIREVSATTGIITTVAGGGSNPGTDGLGDGGPATAAELNNSQNVAVDASGNIYIADGNGIRKVAAATGIITTVAGTDTAPEISVAVDADGNLYMTDSFQRIRKVTVSTGIITTVAGTGTEGFSGDGGPATAAELASLGGLAVDGSGNIFFADGGNQRIREISASTGIITTVAGADNGSYSGDGGPATSAELNGPFGVAVDANGNLYIADPALNRILKVTFPASSTIVTSSVNPSVFGQRVTFTATVSGGGDTPTGAITFQDGSSSLGTGTLSGGSVTFTTSSLPIGTHLITAVYGGDSNFLGSTSAPLTELVKDGLIVTSLTPTSTGFTAAFNKALNLGTYLSPILSLYDNSTGTLGPADVTLVGSSTGPIRGSLVIDQSNTSITFIQTGQTGAGPAGSLFGILPNDTYTVTLRSASNGFQDTNGNLLDGNADGTPGDNFVTTFVVNNPTNSVTVSLPDFARGPGQDVNLPTTATTNGIPLRLLNNASTVVTVTSVTFSLAYNSSLLTITGTGLASGVPGDSSFTIDTSAAGLALVTFTTPTGVVLTGNGTAVFLDLTATVPTTAGYGAKEILDLQNIQINDGSITAIDDDAIHISGFVGDVTGDGIYTGLDAQRISRMAVGLDPGFRQWVLADPLIIGDVSGDNQLTGMDACMVARQAVGITQSTIPALPSLTPVIVGPDPLLSIPTTFQATPGGTLQVPVNLDHSNGLASVNLVIAYDTSRLDVLSAADVQRGSLTAAYNSFTVNLDRTAGVIVVSAYSTSGPLVGAGGASVALIGFHVKDNALPGAAVINLLQNAGSTLTALGGTDSQGNDFLFDLEPRPSNTVGDVLDGRIEVIPAVIVSEGQSQANPVLRLPIRQPVNSVSVDATEINIAVALRSPVGLPVAYSPPGSYPDAFQALRNKSPREDVYVAGPVVDDETVTALTMHSSDGKADDSAWVDDFFNRDHKQGWGELG